MTTRTALARAARALLPLAFLSVAAFATAAVHNHLVKSMPGEGDTLKASPAEIRLWFAERPEVAFTSVTLLRAPDSSRVASIKATPLDDTLAVRAPLPATLPPGSYIVAWRSASRDGHAIRGRFSFTIAP
ncbi:MAG: copper resistance CopC family protein [Gemmatimonadales bacterium]